MSEEQLDHTLDLIEQDKRLQAEADKLGITLEALKERIVLVNNAANTFGQLVMQITEGDWDVATSIAGTFFASTIAQAALAHGRDYKQLWAFLSPGIVDTIGVLYGAFNQEASQFAEGVSKVIEGEATTLDTDTPKVG